MTKVRRAVILAGGMGTRFLPATKAVPKELLPVLNQPLIQFAAEEAVAAGVEEIVIVDAPGKESVRDYFLPDRDYTSILRQRGKDDLAELLEGIVSMARFSFARQGEPLGVADAVRAARGQVEGEPFALMFPDDLIFAATPCLAQLADAWQDDAGALLAVQQVPESEIPQYGIVAVEGGGQLARVTGLVEKPSVEDAPSDLGIVGRYILGAGIFEHIDRIAPSAGGELQITDAFARQIEHGEQVLAYRFKGKRYDTGRPAGMVAATVALALKNPDLRDVVLGEVDAYQRERNA